MTAVPEAQLAREAEICYATMAHVTDYDVWHETEEPVNVQMLIDNLNANAALTKRTIADLIPLLPDERPCDCGQALSTAIITRRELIPREKIEQLRPIIGRYLGEPEDSLGSEAGRASG
jgi:5'-methylthioadenosine phosphorylase